VDLVVPFLAGLAALAAHPEAGHSGPLASEGVCALLDPQIAPSSRKTTVNDPSAGHENPIARPWEAPKYLIRDRDAIFVLKAPCDPLFGAIAWYVVRTRLTTQVAPLNKGGTVPGIVMLRDSAR
jgi:hypothetical protein